MKHITSFKYAFTMIELVFVIVILGIVSSIGSSIIVQVYEGYIIQRATHDASVKTELAINIIANRLVYRIDQSLLARRLGNTHLGLADADAYPAEEVPLVDVDNYPILEWINYDNDSFSSYLRPSWSAFVDLTPSTFLNLITPGSDLPKIGSIMSYYTGSTTEGAAIIFKGSTQYRDDGGGGSGGDYDTKCMYHDDGCIFPVTIPAVAKETLAFHAAGVSDGNRTAGNMLYTEFYELATTAFAIVPTNPDTINTIPVWDLKLYYGYQPWQNENYTNGQNSTLLENVSVFRFKKERNSIRLKLCVIEQIGDTNQISICKEKAVIR